jgi:hypothetical protein
VTERIPSRPVTERIPSRPVTERIPSRPVTVAVEACKSVAIGVSRTERA